MPIRHKRNLCTTVASAARLCVAGAQEPECTYKCMRIPSTAGTQAAERSRLCRGSKALLSICIAVTAPVYAQHGIDANDIKRDGAPCNDFFDYANGAWRAAHAIPDYMDRWSKRWESGEINKEHVRDILADVSK